jgi:hypothetical protein
LPSPTNYVDEQDSPIGAVERGAAELGVHAGAVLLTETARVTGVAIGAVGGAEPVAAVAGGARSGQDHAGPGGLPPGTRLAADSAAALAAIGAARAAAPAPSQELKPSSCPTISADRLSTSCRSGAASTFRS